VKRRKKTEEAKLKETLWSLCKTLTRAKYGLVCYTCDQPTPIPHTGHFIPSSVGGVGLRFDLKNLRPQCYRCNINLSGNWPAYLERMTKEVGEEAVKELLRRRDRERGKADKIFYAKKISEYEKLVI
jgi:hypothetical protein